MPVFKSSALFGLSGRWSRAIEWRIDEADAGSVANVVERLIPARSRAHSIERRHQLLPPRPGLGQEPRRGWRSTFPVPTVETIESALSPGLNWAAQSNEDSTNWFGCDPHILVQRRSRFCTERGNRSS
jgi:hypothetical protein